jgi:hypothetical protein
VSPVELINGRVGRGMGVVDKSYGGKNA